MSVQFFIFSFCFCCWFRPCGLHEFQFNGQTFLWLAAYIYTRKPTNTHKVYKLSSSHTLQAELTSLIGPFTLILYLIRRKPQCGVLLKGRTALLVSSAVWTAATLPAVSGSPHNHIGWIHIWFVLIFWRIIHVTPKMSQQRSKYTSQVPYLPLSARQIHAQHKHTCLHLFLLTDKWNVG